MRTRIWKRRSDIREVCRARLLAMLMAQPMIIFSTGRCAGPRMKTGRFPFELSYWVVPGKFLAGAYPGDPDSRAAERKLGAFLAAGIRCFVDLTAAGERNMFGRLLVPYADLIIKITGGWFRTIYLRMPVADLRVPSRAQMKEILDVIDGAIIGGFPIYVHCLGGIGRTGTVVGCWLARHGIAQGGGAIDLIRRLRRNELHAQFASPETGRQRQFIVAWKKGD